MRKMMIAAALAAGFALPAAAQGNGYGGGQWNGQDYRQQQTFQGNSGQGNSGQGNSGQNWQNEQGNGNLQEQIRQDLARAGFSDIQMEPRSFVVTAKDRNGNPVQMMITPHSMTALTAMGSENGPNGRESGSQWSQQGNQTGSNSPGWGNNRGMMGSNGMSDSGHSGGSFYSQNGNGSYSR